MRITTCADKSIKVDKNVWKNESPEKKKFVDKYIKQFLGKG